MNHSTPERAEELSQRGEYYEGYTDSKKLAELLTAHRQ